MLYIGENEVQAENDVNVILLLIFFPCTLLWSVKVIIFVLFLNTTQWNAWASLKTKYETNF